MKPITLEWIEKAEGDFATADEAVKICHETRRAIRKSLGLEK